MHDAPALTFREALELREYDTARGLIDAHPELRDAMSPHTRTPWILDRVRARDADGVRFLAGLGFDPNEADAIGQLPLMLAAQLGMRDVVAALIDAGADPHRTAIPYPSVLAAAIHGGDPETVEMLVHAGARMEGNAFHSLLSSPPREPEKFAAILDVLSRHGYDVNVTTAQGFSALDESALMGDAARVRLLLERGANPNTGRRTHNNPLCAAVFSGNPSVVAMLLDAGAAPRVFYREFEQMWCMFTEAPGKRASVMAVLRRHGVLGVESAARSRHEARRRRRARHGLPRYGLPDARHAAAMRMLGITRKHPTLPAPVRRIASRGRLAWQVVYGMTIDHDVCAAPRPASEDRVISLGERESWDHGCG